MEKYVLTGGPGVGKTTLIKLLRGKGYDTLPEAARIMIRYERLKARQIPGYVALHPETHLEPFQDLVIDFQLEKEKTVNGNKTFLDRSLVDPVAYAKVGNVGIRNCIYDEIERAGYKKIFFLDRLSNYVTDAVRHEDDDMAKKIHDAIFETYNKMGLDVIVLADIGLENRLEMVMSHVR